MSTHEELLELARRQEEALADAELAAADERHQRDIDDALARDALSGTQRAESDALAAYNQAQYNNVGQIISDVEGKINTAKQKDETARRRENAFRYISGLGDTLASVANLVGVVNGAANQKQTYNSNAVVQKAEEARKARKIEMEDLSKRLDELTARQRDLKASGSLAEVQLKAKQDRELYELQSKQRAKAEEAKRYADAQAHTAMREARADWVADRAFNTQQENWQKTYDMQYAKFRDEQDAKNYNFTLADGSIDIPKDKLNEVNVERIFQMLPPEVRENVKGDAVTEYEVDEYGNSVRKTGYKAPSLAQKLAAIGAYADSDEAIKNELRRLAGLAPRKKQDKKDGSEAAPAEDFSQYKRKSVPSTPMTSSPVREEAHAPSAPRNVAETTGVPQGTVPAASIAGGPVLMDSVRSRYGFGANDDELKRIMGI